MKHSLAAWICSGVLLGGCASNAVTVSIPSEAVLPTALAHVRVRDMRSFKGSASQREAAFGVPMGYVNFDPPEATLVKNLLENQLSALLRQSGVTTPQDFTCDMTEFRVTTKATMLYWDVVGHIRLILKHGSQTLTLYGTDGTRTYVWPGKEVIAKVIDGSLAQIAKEIEQTGPELVGPGAASHEK